MRGLDQKTVQRLKERACRHGRSLHQEVKEILERAVTTLTMSEARQLSETWRRCLGGRSVADSAPLIREDRDSR